MRVLILKDYVGDAASIREKILTNYPSIESIIICQSPEQAIEQVKMYGTHVIVLNLEHEGAPGFLAQVKDHPHRIINTAQNSYPDYFTARFLGINSKELPGKNSISFSTADSNQYSPAFTI